MELIFCTINPRNHQGILSENGQHKFFKSSFREIKKNYFLKITELNTQVNSYLDRVNLVL